MSETDEGGRATKRKLGKVVRDIQAVHKTIKKMPDINFSDYTTLTNLPFPSPLTMPFQRFGENKIDGIPHFEYMGRSQFCDLQRRIERAAFLNGSETLYLYGSSGSGKSHLLAALAYHLVREGKCVFYIPNCHDLLLTPLSTMRDAYNFAYHDPLDPGAFKQFGDVEEVVRCLNCDPDVYIIIDQVNVLELVTGNSDGRNDRKIQVIAWLDLLKPRNRYLFSASANENSNREIFKKQHGITVIPAFGGLDSDETNHWFLQHHDQIPQLSPEQRQQAEYLTGCMPLLLKCLTEIANFDELDFRKIPGLVHLASDVSTFAVNKLATLNPLDRENYLKIMSACVRGDRVTYNDQSLFDLRYFYVDAEGNGCSTCGIALEGMVSILRAHSDAPFLDALWYEAVERSNNPIVRGFLAEQICLSHIATSGLQAVHPGLDRMPSASFDDKPAFDNFLSTERERCLYIPTAYNFKTVDGAILLLDRQSKKATIFAIQFTLSDRHKQSDVEFHTELWSKWIKPIVRAEFTVDSTFVWIDTKEPSQHVHRKTVRALRSGDQVVHPEYSVIHVDVETVDRKLARALKLII